MKINIITDIFGRPRYRIAKQIPSVRRVYRYDELGLRSKEVRGGFWDVKNIDDEPHLIDKVYKHIRSASDVRVFCNDKITMTCDTACFGIVKCVMSPSLGFFEFCVYSNGVRYDINYALMRNEHSEFVSWLQNNVLKHYAEYQNDKNL